MFNKNVTIDNLFHYLLPTSDFVELPKLITMINNFSETKMKTKHDKYSKMAEIKSYY